LAETEGLGLACGLGPSTALTVHRTVIHYRFAFESLLNKKREQQQKLLLSLDWKSYFDRKYGDGFKLMSLGSNGQFEPKGLLYA